jgi:predicted alpha/beta-fold hydrolase
MNNNTVTVENNQGHNPIRNFHERTRAIFEKNPFRPHRLFKGAHVQTLAAFAWPRRRRYRATADEARLIQTEPEVQVLAHCRWQPDRRKHATIIIWHGIEGSSTSNYMLSTAHKAFRAGFNVVRMNVRTCGGTEHLTSTIYHGGLTEDLHAVVKEFIERDQLPQLLLVGFSLGGNMVLKLAGEYGDYPPPEILGIAAVSPSVDLSASAEGIMKRSNWLYQRDFMTRLKKRARTKNKLFPGIYDLTGLDDVHTIKEFDDRFTARAHNFAGADDYYYRASSIRVLDRIRIPTLMIHAEDDPFIPFAPLRHPSIAANPYLLLVAPKRGGHVAFLTDGQGDDYDRFWAENRVIDFCRLAADSL